MAQRRRTGVYESLKSSPTLFLKSSMSGCEKRNRSLASTTNEDEFKYVCRQVRLLLSYSGERAPVGRLPKADARAPTALEASLLKAGCSVGVSFDVILGQIRK